MPKIEINSNSLIQEQYKTITVDKPEAHPKKILNSSQISMKNQSYKMPDLKKFTPDSIDNKN